VRILLDADPNSPERAPKIHRELWKHWGVDLPSVHSLKNTLIFDWKPPFNENSVDGFIKEYKDTIAFAKLLESDKVASEVEDNGDGNELYVAQIGDWVQWEHNGVLGFKEPTRVKGLSPDGEWAYVDGQNGCVPRKELLRESAPLPKNPLDPLVIPRFVSPPKNTMHEFVVPLSDGSKAVFQWPTYITEGDLTNLKDSIKILERMLAQAALAKTSGQA
jgi:hypothetical protein